MSDPADPGDLQPQGDPAIATNFEEDPSTGAAHQGFGEALLSTGVVMGDAHYAEDHWQYYQQDVDEPQIPTE
jgi:hypothetical protein